MSEFCIDCEHYSIGVCGLRNICPYPPDRLNCDKFAPKAVKTVVLQDNKWSIIEEKKPTIFDRITASPEVLAPKFVYYVTSFLDGLDKPKKIWYSTLINNQYFKTELEAKRATVAKLKEVEK